MRIKRLLAGLAAAVLLVCSAPAENLPGSEGKVSEITPVGGEAVEETDLFSSEQGEEENLFEEAMPDGEEAFLYDEAGMPVEGEDLFSGGDAYVPSDVNGSASSTPDEKPSSEEDIFFVSAMDEETDLFSSGEEISTDMTVTRIM